MSATLLPNNDRPLLENDAVVVDDDWFNCAVDDAAVDDKVSPSKSPKATVATTTTSTLEVLPVEEHTFPLLPPQLHPAVSLGLQRVSSCYFSIGSEEERKSMTDLLSLWDEASADGLETNRSHSFGLDTSEDTEQILFSPSTSSPKSSSSSFRQSTLSWNSSDVLYHDVLMNVFTFLDAPSLTAFSETARRPNFEVFYYLQLQLQRALLVDNTTSPHFAKQYHHHQHSITNTNTNTTHHPPEVITTIDNGQGVAGSGCLSRLAMLRPQEAQSIVMEYQESNSTLRTMPLSHSLAYIRHVLQRNGFHAQMKSSPSSSQALASAALFVTVVGAAYMSGGTEHIDSFGTELPNMLFRVGFMGSLMGAARQLSTDSEQRPSMRDMAEQMTRMMQQVPSSLFKQKNREDDPQDHARNSMSSNRNEDEASKDLDQRFPSFTRMVHILGSIMPKSASSPPSCVTPSFPSSKVDKDGLPCENFQHPDPYEHIPTATKEVASTKQPEKKIPSGCVGAYSRAIQKSATWITQLVKEQRKERFHSLSLVEQVETATAFLDACRSDENLPLIREMVQVIDTDGFYLGSDGTETCALHTAAFNGASKVLEFLCQTIHDNDPNKDGGLCDVNIKDDNGWTALHFAAGGNSASAARVLIKHGAELMVEAVNGYTALQWAQRLSNEEVADELSRHNTAEQLLAGWITSQPLTKIANRFFSFIPTH